MSRNFLSTESWQGDESRPHLVKIIDEVKIDSMILLDKG
jgi:hypothetical protein